MNRGVRRCRIDFKVFCYAAQTAQFFKNLNSVDTKNKEKIKQ